ncbi:Dimethylaniline Monooxygenase [N-Oxide-Forming] 6-Like [Manis pentadactyla]|nr:Dimethylaniline Monooxygenase [N-Oxide-Forming] 6-Like [Manis pentadactyla]
MSPLCRSSSKKQNYDSQDAPGLSPAFPPAHWLLVQRAAKWIGHGHTGLPPLAVAPPPVLGKGLTDN